MHCLKNLANNGNVKMLTKVIYVHGSQKLRVRVFSWSKKLNGKLCEANKRNEQILWIE